MGARVIAEHEEAEVLELYARGWSLRKIGEWFGCSDGPAANILKAHGVKRRTAARPRAVVVGDVWDGTVREVAERSGISMTAVTRRRREARNAGRN